MDRRWLVGCAGPVAAAVLLAACASGNGSEQAASAGPGTESAVVHATTPSVTAAAQNKSAAQAEADRLVSLALLPPGAVRKKGQPTGLSGPALGTPQTSQLIDSVSYYRVAMSLPRARAWFEANSQPGFSQSGKSSRRGPAGSDGFGFEFEPSPPPHWTWGNANLEIGLVSQGSTGTAIRVDGLAQWINPTPTPDAARGPAMRVTVAGGCPATDRGRSDVSNPGDTDLDHQMLPAAAPSAALDCIYTGMNGTTFTLISSQQLTAAQAAVAADKIRAVPLGSEGNGPHSCPMDDARVSILAFSYLGRADIDIWEHTSGCASIDNGHIVADGF